MKSVGEVMAIGRTFKEALQKGIRSLEPHTPWRAPADTPASLLREKLATPRPDRIHWLMVAIERGLGLEEIAALTKIDPWFLRQLEEIAQVNRRAGRGHGGDRVAGTFAGGQAVRRKRRATGAGVENHGGGRAPPAGQSARRARLQAGGYLRGRV